LVPVGPLYLVRPDGDIAYRNSGTDLAGVTRYLAHWLRADAGN
jgi:hypothetical protein